MNNWEYKLLFVNVREGEVELLACLSKGWSVVTTTATGFNAQYLLKRLKEPRNENSKTD